jgi:2-iminobutanoate/2-iminopropanoate deaminase
MKMEKMFVPFDMEKEKPIGACSKAVKVVSPKAFIFVSTLAATKNGVLVKGDIETQTRQAFENLKVALTQVGATLKDVVQIHASLVSRKDYAGFNKIRKEYFGDNFPTSSTRVVKEILIEGALVDIGVVAAI